MKHYTFTKKIVLALSIVSSSVALSADHTINWVLAHQPARVFERAAKHFAAEVERESKGRIAVNIKGLSTDPNAKELSPYEAFKMVRTGEVEMCQTYTTYLGQQSKDLWVLDLPFLFRDHEHASKVLDGEIGKSLLAGLESKGVKGLGFTYSGGFRVIPSNKALTKMSDFKNLKIRTTDSPVAKTYMKNLGATPVFTEDANHYSKGIQAFETTFARLPAVKTEESKFINVTEHSLFLTSIIVNKKFYDSLPDDLKIVVSNAVASTAKLERTDSIKDNDDQRKIIEAGKNTKVVDISTKLKSEMKKSALKVQDDYKNYFSVGLVDQIKAN